MVVHEIAQHAVEAIHLGGGIQLGIEVGGIVSAKAQVKVSGHKSPLAVRDLNAINWCVFNIIVANSEVDESTGNVKLPLVNGSLLTSYFKFTKGRLIVEFEEINAAASAQFGFNFYGENGEMGNRNFNFYLYEDSIYRFKIGGKYSTEPKQDWWRNDIINEQSKYIDLSQIKKVEFSCSDDPNNQGMLTISLYINDESYGTFSNMYDVFADGDPKIYFHVQCKKTPTQGSYCIVKSITYIPAE